jgi:ribose-phosphate pyrophosphokinase
VIGPVHAFADEAAAAGRLADALGVGLGLVSVHRFPDEETLPTIPGAGPTVIVYRSLDRPNPKLMPLLQACDAWRRAGVQRLVLVAPYMSYLRQDALFAPGQSLSRDVMGELLSPRFDRIVTVDPHLHRTPDLSASWGVPVTVLSAAPVLGAALAGGGATLVVGPDVEAGPWAAAVAAELGVPHLTLQKSRHGDRDVRISLADPATVEGQSVALVDDVCSSGSTLARAVELLRKAGAASVDVAITHALMDDGALARLREAGAGRIVSTDSCIHPTNAAPLADLLAAALREELSR